MGAANKKVIEVFWQRLRLVPHYAFASTFDRQRWNRSRSKLQYDFPAPDEKTVTRMGRKTRYSAQTVETILAAVRHSGSDRLAIEAAGISEATYYRWQQEYREFREGIAQAKQEYRENCPDVLRQQAHWSFEDYLYGRVEEVWTTHETVRDGDKIIYREIVKKVKRGVPQWAIERVLGKSVDELEAVKCLVESGWIPRHVLIVATESLDEMRDRVRQAFQPEDPKN